MNKIEQLSKQAKAIKDNYEDGVIKAIKDNYKTIINTHVNVLNHDCEHVEQFGDLLLHSEYDMDNAYSNYTKPVLSIKASSKYCRKEVELSREEYPELFERYEIAAAQGILDYVADRYTIKVPQEDKKILDKVSDWYHEKDVFLHSTLKIHAVVFILLFIIVVGLIVDHL